MRLRFSKPRKKALSLSFSLKYGAIFCLFFLSILIAACSSSADSTANPGSPAVTTTINMDGNNGSPTPALPPYSCGAWATQTTPSYYGTSVVGIYGKFVQNVDGNPQGVDGASATATVYWPAGEQTIGPNTTGTDGLVVFSVPTANRPDAINKITLVTITFTKDGGPSCTVSQDRAAFFTLVVGTPGNSTGSPVGSGFSPTPGGPPPTGIPGTPLPTPKPTKTPKGGH